MSMIGYARVSSTDQDLTSQIDSLREAGCDKIFSEKVSGAARVPRTQLDLCLSYVREGDVLVVTRLDRLARSLVDLKNIIAQLEEKGVGFQCTLQPVETVTAAGRLMISMLGAFAEFEREMIHERQMLGIQRAKNAGIYKGRPPKVVVTPEQIAPLVEQGLGASEIARRLNVPRRQIYRHAPPGMFGGVFKGHAAQQA